ncbi:MAG TPA: DNA-directed RNA polymerase subunit beta [Planococcus sp. (in: firmicutes)]|nr:DNA-directed RNA polymerase subunit beta [Planococcus sp. (in: firmicutes)]
MAEPTKKVSARKEHKNEEATGDKQQKKTWWVQIRMFPIWLRIILVTALIVLAAALGAMVGYGVIGDGEPRDALQWETWQHIIDIISGKK